MFTIKFMKDGGYTTYECVSYGVSWEPNGKPVVYMRTTRNSRDSEVDPLIIPVEQTAYVENSEGKTIDKLVASPVAQSKTKSTHKSPFQEALVEVLSKANL